MIQKTFFFLSSPLKPKRSSTILLFLSFSHESSMSECVKKNRRVFLCWVGRLTIACRVDYLHKGVLDNDGWNGHHDQAHIFLEERIVIFFFILVFLSSRFKCRLLHFSLQLYSFLHRLILKLVFVEKENVESVLLQRARLIVTRWCLWFDEPLGIQGEILRWTGMRYFPIFFYLPNHRDLVIRNNIVICVLQTSFCWKKIPKSP